MNNSKRKLFALTDVVIIVVVVIIAAFAFFSQLNKPDTNLSCVIRVNGEVVDTHYLDSLSSDTYVVYEGVRIMLSSDGVAVVDSSCPDKLCQNTGVITRGGQSIVCLPNKVSVTLISDSNAVDAVTR